MTQLLFGANIRLYLSLYIQRIAAVTLNSYSSRLQNNTDVHFGHIYEYKMCKLQMKLHFIRGAEL